MENIDFENALKLQEDFNKQEEETFSPIVKVYYDKESGYLCNRYPTDIEVKENTPYIEIDTSIEENRQLLDSTYVCESGKVWAVINNELKLIDNIEEQNSKEYKLNQINNEIIFYKNQLTSTDYKALKFFEGEITEEEYEPTKQLRIEWRKKINELEKEASEYGNQ